QHPTHRDPVCACADYERAIGPSGHAWKVGPGSRRQSGALRSLIGKLEDQLVDAEGMLTVQREAR
ncbi:MAG TPA: hypothetical protein VGE94_18055, partial [Chloroflexota bacterium]